VVRVGARVHVLVCTLRGSGVLRAAVQMGKGGRKRAEVQGKAGEVGARHRGKLLGSGQCQGEVGYCMHVHSFLLAVFFSLLLLSLPPPQNPIKKTVGSMIDAKLQAE
jgi:hypothetical protein